MAGLRASAKPFARSYKQRTENLLELAGSPLEGLSADAVHDLRVAARRVQMLCKLLPRNLRRSEAHKRFSATLGSLLRTTSRVRDLDTLTLTLRGTKASLPAGLLDNLSDERADALRGAKSSIEAVSGAFPPPVNFSQIDGRKLSRRLRKRIGRRSKEVIGLLDKVLSDESGIEDLHAMRKEVKKLRYLLELADKPLPELPVLTAWQEELGEVHDLDVAVNHLKQSRLRFPRQKAIAELRKTRHSGYQKFTRECRRSSSVKLRARLAGP